MPTINVEGRKVRVGEEFLGFTPEEQQAVVDEIASQMGPGYYGAEPESNVSPGFRGFLEGVGQGFANTGRGLAQINAKLNPGVLSREQAAQAQGVSPEDIQAARERDAELLDTKRGFAGSVTGSIASALPAAALPGANTVVGSGVIGAGLGAFQPVVDESERIANTALGGALGAGIPAAGRYIGNKFRGRGRDIRNSIGNTDDVNGVQPISRESASAENISNIAESTARTGQRYADDVALLRNNGVDLTTGQRTGSTAVRTFETTTDKTMLGGALDATHTRQREQFQRQLMRLSGFPDDIAKRGQINDDALEGAGKAFAQRYSDALKGRSINLSTDDFIDAIGNIEAKHGQLVTSSQRQEIRSLIDDFLNDAVSGPIDGGRYQYLRSLAGRRARQTENSQPWLADIFHDMRAALDDAFVKSTGETNRALNREYAHFRQLESVWRSNGGAAVARGELPLASLNRLAKKSPGSQEWRRLVNAGSAVLGDTVGNSGTASRAASLLDMGTLGVPAFVVNQTLARGVGGGAPMTASRGLQQAGSAITGASSVSGIPAAAGGASLLNSQNQAARILSQDGPEVDERKRMLAMYLGRQAPVQ